LANKGSKPAAAEVAGDAVSEGGDGDGKGGRGGARRGGRGGREGRGGRGDAANVQDLFAKVQGGNKKT